MRTNIDIDDELLDQAFSVSRMRTKKKLIHEALKVYIQLKEAKGPYRIGGHHRIPQGL